MTEDDLSRSTVKLVAGLLIACLLLQRFGIPGQPVPLILPLIIVWALCGVAASLMEFNRLRLSVWLVTAGATALLLPVQSFVLGREYVSLTAWGLFMVVWAPFTLHLVDRRMTTYVAMLRATVTIHAYLAGLAVFMMVSQFAGLPYRDYLADVVPEDFLLSGFVITYPIAYESPIYRANAWIALEPSMISLQLGVALLAALLVGSRVWVVALLFTGLVFATSGSGFAILAAGLVVMLLSSSRQQLRRFGLPTLALIPVGLLTPMGQSIAGRLFEGGTEQSSTSLRAIEPYGHLWPIWTESLTGVLMGFGPGSAQRSVDQTGILGLLVPTPAKVYFEYGLLAGTLLAVMMLLAYARGPSRAISLAMLASLWTLQPGTTTMLVLVPVLLLVTWWSPRPTRFAIEDAFGSGATPRAHSPGPLGPNPGSPCGSTHGRSCDERVS